MGGLYSRRLRYGIGAIGLVFALLVCLRLIFVLGFSGVGLQEAALLETLGIGLRFDLRLAVLMLLPLALLAWLPRWNLLNTRALRWLARGYLLLVLGVVGLVYIIDFGHYAYLGVRLNATVLRYLEDAQVSRQMVWETYPVQEQEWLSVAVVTQPAMDQRRPLILDEEGQRAWLDPKTPEHVLQGLLAARQTQLRERPLANLINDPALNGPQCLTPL